MSTDLETQLQAVGRALDDLSPAVRADETASRGADRASQPTRFEFQPDASAGRHAHSRRLAVLSTAAVLIVGLVGALAAFGRPGQNDSPATSDRSPSTVPVGTTDGGAVSTVLAVQPRVVEATVVPGAVTVRRPDVFPVATDPAMIDVFGSYQSRPIGAFPVLAGLVAKLDGDRLTDGLRFETVPKVATDSFQGTLETVTIDGIDVDVFTQQSDPVVRTAVLPGSAVIAVTGRDPVSFLRSSGLGVVVADWVGSPRSMTIDSAVLPDGYSVVVEPELTEPDQLSAYTSTGLATGDGPGATVQLDNPLLDVAVRSDVERTTVAGVVGWIAPSSGGHTVIWQTSPTTWASVRARGAADETLTSAESIGVAERFEFVDEATWRATYRVAEPAFGDDVGAVVAIDVGNDEGVEVGLLVQMDGEPIGKIMSVTDSTSQVLLVSNADFVVDATLVPESGGLLPQDCRVRGGNDHVGFVCDSPFDDRVRPGAQVIAVGSALIPDGSGLGTITSIVEIGDEQVAVLDLLRVFPVAGDSVSVIVPGR